MPLQHVLITGVSGGLGHALALRCLEQGVEVHGLSRRVPDELVRRAGFRHVSADLRQLDAVPGALERLLAGVEALDLILLNAGLLGPIDDLTRTTISELREVMDVNVWANKVLIDALLAGPARVDQVVAISSGAAFNGSGGWGAYSISKSALNLLVRVYAHEHPETHFAALAPGVVDTPMVRHILSLPDDPRYSASQRLQAAHEAARIQAPEAAAERVLGAAERLRAEPSGRFADVREM